MGKYINGNKEGLWRESSHNGFEEGIYKNNKREGLWKEWDEDGKISSKTYYKEGFECGLYKEWWENGQLYCQGNFKYGSKIGLWKLWYESGELHCESNYKYVEEFEISWEDGFTREYWKNGKLQYEWVMKDGEEISKKSWDKNGNLKTK